MSDHERIAGLPVIPPSELISSTERAVGVDRIPLDPGRVIKTIPRAALGSWPLGLHWQMLWPTARRRKSYSNGFALDDCSVNSRSSSNVGIPTCKPGSMRSTRSIWRSSAKSGGDPACHLDGCAPPRSYNRDYDVGLLIPRASLGSWPLAKINS